MASASLRGPLVRTLLFPVLQNFCMLFKKEVMSGWNRLTVGPERLLVSGRLVTALYESVLLPKKKEEEIHAASQEDGRLRPRQSHTETP